MALFSRHAVLEWTGDVPRGSGHVAVGSNAFTVAATFPRLSGEPTGVSTPEELLAASHANCFGIGLRSVLAQRGGAAVRLRETATVSGDKGGGRIRVVETRLEAVVHGLTGVDESSLDDIARTTEDACTIGAAPCERSSGPERAYWWSR